MKFRNLKNSILDFLRTLEDKPLPLYSTGLSALDYAIGGGIAPGEMCVMAARPSHGKTLMGLQILRAMAKQGLPGLFVSEEMSLQALIERTVRAMSDEAAQRKFVNDWASISDELMEDTDAHFRGVAPILVAERCGSADAVSNAIKEAVDNHGVKIVVVDYVQVLAKGSSGGDKFAQVGAASQVLKQAALETNVAMICLAQMGRSIDERSKWVPMMSDIQHSSQIEQDADTLIFLEWPWQRDKTQRPHVYRMWIVKNRNRGIHGDSCIELEFDAKRQTITDRMASAVGSR